MINITTDRLLIRNFSSDDAVALREIVLSKESSDYAAYDYEWPTSEEGISNILARFSGYDGFLAVCVRHTGEVAGFLSFDPTSEEPGQFNLGYCLHPNYQHRGYVTEACIGLLNYAFDALDAVRINSGTAALNTPSVAVLERLGMRKIGEEMFAFRKSEAGAPVSFTGWLYELTRDDWAARGAGEQRAAAGRVAELGVPGKAKAEADPSKWLPAE